jgi:carbonic anhydrase
MTLSTRLIPAYSLASIPAAYRDTPIERLVAFHNLGRPAPVFERAEILLATCMDNRTALRVPERFAFIIRTAAGNLRDNEFRTAFAIGVGGVRTIAIIGHTDCGMVRLSQRRRQFVEGLVRNAGWKVEDAERYFDESAPRFEITDEAEFAIAEARRIRGLYPQVLVAPMIFRVETGMLYLVRED